MIRQPEGGFLLASVGGLLVERDGRALTDAGAGPLTMGPPLNTYGVMTGGALLDNLAALGRGPADIEAIALTHLHADHGGWARHPAPGSDRPAFTAGYLVAEPEWTQRHYAEAQGMGDMIKALAPQVRTHRGRGRGDRPRRPHQVHPWPQRRARRPRHRRGRAAGDRLRRRLPLPLQIGHPLWENTFDFEHQQSTSLRTSLLTELAKPNTVGFGIHFAACPSAASASTACRPGSRWTPENGPRRGHLHRAVGAPVGPVA